MNPNLPRLSLTLMIVIECTLGALFFVGIGALALLPGLSADIAASLPEYAGLRMPLLALATAITVLGLVSLVMIALIVCRIYRGSVLAPASLLWLDVIVGSLGAAAFLIAIAFVVISNGQAGSPFLALVQLVGILALVVLAYIALKFRSRLRRAITMRAELDEAA
ncbi:DUF2975 domain-containing protein [Homoserinimonas hongtaonis]|uniref:DUF2975 domain-containing protein n=1 Tax=Homoserinimonas hongtaonis TaxID=2079791 RepID=UPI000D3833FE|nr:DUF2975 domain-containing protein [Salinibacterium hongtaonis]AWB89141.1 hypothetical protein C2138_05950 [Salinibacterium hongtaonis]